MKNKLFIYLLFSVITITAVGQELIELPKYSFIKYDTNILHYDTNSPQMQQFFKKWHHVTTTGQGTINIVHIGGSHVQAGTMTHRIRCNILNQYPNLVGARGMLFPYSAAARCNNPADYKVHCPEKVQLTRNVYKEPEYNMGLCGIAITAKDSMTTIQILMNEPRFDFATSQIVLLGDSPNNEVMPYLNINNEEIYPNYVDMVGHRYVFNLNSTTDSFDIKIPCDSAQTFTLRGVYLNNHKPGFTYHSIGVNGAAVPDYFKCPYFCNDLRLTRPDLVVFGIGINDAHGPHFDSIEFKQNYLQLIDSIKAVNPNCALIFITNNDCYRRLRRRTYTVNNNGPLVRDVFYRLAAETGGAVWDQFQVMGGLRSMERWRINKLARYDRVHFTHKGYELIGDLFTNALFQAYIDYQKKLDSTDERYPYISY